MIGAGAATHIGGIRRFLTAGLVVSRNCYYRVSFLFTSTEEVSHEDFYRYFLLFFMCFGVFGRTNRKCLSLPQMLTCGNKRQDAQYIKLQFYRMPPMDSIGAEGALSFLM
jgi:hypothetical protein